MGQADTRVMGVGEGTVARVLTDCGRAGMALHDERVP